jgi:hypothetical protein
MLGSIHRHWGHCNEAARVYRGLDWRHGTWVAISGIAQQPDRLRQIGALLIGAGPLSDEFARQLERLGWIEGHNIHIEMRTHSGDSYSQPAPLRRRCFSKKQEKSRLYSHRAPIQLARAQSTASCQLDGAVLDINLRGELVFPLVAALKRRGLPFIFATGYDRGNIPQQYRDVPPLREAAGYPEDRGSAFPLGERKRRRPSDGYARPPRLTIRSFRRRTSFDADLPR